MNCKRNRKNIYDILQSKYGSDCDVSIPLLKDTSKLYKEVIFGNSSSNESPNIIFNLKTLNPFIVAHAERCNNVYIISISKKLLSIIDPKKKKYHVGGINCEDRLSCIQTLFEHELIHVVKDICKGDVSETPHGKEFVKLMKNLVCHKIATNNLLDGIVIPLHIDEKIRLCKGDYVDLRVDTELKTDINHSIQVEPIWTAVKKEKNVPFMEKVGIIKKIKGKNITVELANGREIDVIFENIKGIIPRESIS